MVLFQRLQASRTTKFVRSLLVFSSLVMGLHGPDYLVGVVDSVQPKCVCERAMGLSRIQIQVYTFVEAIDEDVNELSFHDRWYSLAAFHV